MESSDSIDKSWDTSSETTTTAQRSDPMASDKPTEPNPAGWMVNVTGRDIAEMSHADVISKRRSGELAGSVLVWREGMENWARLDSVPAFQIVAKPEGSKAAPRPKEESGEDANTNLFAVYERPAPTLVFDEGVESEWKAAPSARESSKSVRGSEPSKTARSASARPLAPSVPPLAPRRTQVVPSDEPPPPPPLPPRRSPAPARMSARPAPTIPGGLLAPSRAPTAGALSVKSTLPPASTSLAPKSTLPPTSASLAAPKGVGPASNPSSPLLAAIAAAASNPEPIVVAAPAAPVPLAAPVAPAAPLLDEVSVSARLRAMKSVPLKHAALACAGSALVASLVTALVVGTSSRHAARREVEPVVKAVAAAPAPSPPPPAAPPPEPAAASKGAATPTPEVDKVALSDLDPAEKPKAKSSKAHAWKPPRAVAPATEPGGESDKPTSSLERDDPVRAIPDGPDERSSSRPASWQADPGF